MAKKRLLLILAFSAALAAPFGVSAQAPLLTDGDVDVTQMDAIPGPGRAENDLKTEIETKSTCTIPQGATLKVSPGGIVQFLKSAAEKAAPPEYSYGFRVDALAGANPCGKNASWIYVNGARDGVEFKRGAYDSYDPRKATELYLTRPQKAISAKTGDDLLERARIREEIQATSVQVADVAGKINQAPMLQGKSTPAADCWECEQARKTPLKVDYEQCSSNNNYLEHMFEVPTEPAYTYAKAAPQDLEVARCIFLAQKSAPKRGYANCSNGAARPPKKRIAKACLSQKSHQFTANSFADATDCFGLNAKEMIPLVAHESGFQPNAWSGTGAGGFGQFTQVAIKDVNHRWSRYQEMVKQSPKKSCERLRPVMEKEMAHPPSQRCNAMVPPNSAAKNFVYTSIFFLENRKMMGKFLDGLLKSSSISKEAKDEFAGKLGTLAHNVGPYQARRLYLKYIETIAGAGASKASADPLGPGFQGFLKRNAGGVAGEPKVFLEQVAARGKALNKSMGGQGKCTAY